VIPRSSRTLARRQALGTEPPSRLFCRRCWCPHLRPGPVVVLDTLKAHQVAGVREAIEAVGARLIYPPPSSPPLSPIEACWANLETLMRTKPARRLECLWQAITR
jgi:transposase